ncbi:unnamed protein product [Oncorhynchus mykiss]|uniref:BROMI middle region domain-containing protein n=1 Tax=Oncorhynchus mykiss TaxID=8022 RepID=A0A060XCC6_ONCMY|nr:unnamed protein product [Oncorhynchus mykiss]
MRKEIYERNLVSAESEGPAAPPAFSSFTKKLQARPCDKFGYGVMVTQVAATTPGVVALHSSVFVQALVVELWSVLECGREDVRVVHPKSTRMDFIDSSCVKITKCVMLQPRLPPASEVTVQHLRHVVAMSEGQHHRYIVW